jgi:hypothetical protein
MLVTGEQLAKSKASKSQAYSIKGRKLIAVVA